MDFWRKGAALLLAMVLAAVLLCACASRGVNDVGDATDPEATLAGDAPAAGTEVALLTTEARLESDFGQGVWNSIARFAGENGASCGAYKTEPDDADAALATLELAVRSGASMVVCMDEGVSGAVSGSLMAYPAVRFVLLDAPADIELRSNAVALRFSGQQAGFLAGYAAAYEDDALLGVALSDSAVSEDYALGFLMGAETAAAEQGLDPESLWVIWLQEGGGELDAPEDDSAPPPQAPEGDAAPSWAEQVAGLYERQARVVFAADPAGQDAVLEAAREADGKMLGIGPEVAGAAVLGSVGFDARQMVYDQLLAWRDGLLAGGTDVVGGVADGAVTLALDASRFERAREWILQQGPLRFEDGSLAERLERRLARREDGSLPSPGDLGLTHLVVVTPARYDALMAQQAEEANWVAPEEDDSEAEGEVVSSEVLPEESEIP